MKIYQWIDKYNYKNSLKIISDYSDGLAKGKGIFYSFNPIFWDKYLIRFVLVFSSVITFQKSAYKALVNLLSDKHSPFYSSDFNSQGYIKFRDLTATLFGFRYFVDEQTLSLLAEKETKHEKIKFEINSNPEVSIIINNCLRLDYLYNCLSSIRKNSESQSFEIIILNNHENHFITNFLRNVSGTKVLSVSTDVTYDEMAKVVIEQALGKYIHLLNCNVHVKTNWLKPLIETLRLNDLGSVGSKIISLAGIINTAGKLMNEDKIAIHKHRDHPEFNYQVQVNFCTADSLALSRRDFLKLELGSLSSKNTDEFGKEISIALKKKLNKNTFHQPLSEVISYKQLIPSNQNLISSSEYKKNAVLFIDDEIPAPDRDSGSNRIFQIMLLVKSLGYHVIFLPVTGEKRKDYFEQMIYAGFEVLYQFPNRKGMIKIMLDKMPEIMTAWLCKPHNNKQFKFIFEANKNCKWIYDTIDLHFVRIQREAELSKSDIIKKEAELIKALEIDIAKRADTTLAITDDERFILEEEGIKQVKVIPNIHELRNNSTTEKSFINRDGILFIGGYLHKPNIDAAKWLINEIMPIVWKSIPELRVTLLGSNPPEEVLQLQSKHVRVPGYLHDVSSYFNNSKIFVAPLRFGAGMKGKIGQSLEFGLPIISTDIGIEGVGLSDNENVIVANQTVAFANKIVMLYNNEELWNKIRNNSLEALKAYTPNAVKEKLRALLEN